MALWRSTVIVSAMTMLSRVLGLVRDIVLLNVFGAGKDFDTFVVAFRIPNFFRRLFAEGAFSQAFIPVLTEYKTGRTHAEVQILISRVFGCLMTVMTALTFIAMSQLQQCYTSMHRVSMPIQRSSTSRFQCSASPFLIYCLCR